MFSWHDWKIQPIHLKHWEVVAKAKINIIGTHCMLVPVYDSPCDSSIAFFPRKIQDEALSKELAFHSTAEEATARTKKKERKRKTLENRQHINTCSTLLYRCASIASDNYFIWFPVKICVCLWEWIVNNNTQCIIFEIRQLQLPPVKPVGESILCRF